MTFQCDNCKGIFEREPGWSDEKAMAEHDEVFGVSEEPQAVVCDDCYEQIMNSLGSMRLQ
jgi:hypothetical protein